MTLRKNANKVHKVALPLFLSLGLMGLQGCDSDSSSTASTTGSESTTALDITNAVFTERSADCADYANTYDASALDIQNSTAFTAAVEITATDSECTFVSNSVPNHDFNDDTAAFAGGADGATISEIDVTLTVTRSPAIAATSTPISQELKNAIFLNGVKLDIISAGCYSPEDADASADGTVGIGCQSDNEWLLDPLGTTHKFGADAHNAHTQPEGLYHYHGSPLAMYDDNPTNEGSPVIGFAADGFPVYGPYFYDSLGDGTVRKAVSGYTLKTASRGTQDDIGPDYNPGGTPDGTYNNDWEWLGTTGDLDACNGMTVDGQYGYYVTETYPWVIKCLSGTPDESFGSTETGTTQPPPPGAGG